MKKLIVLLAGVGVAAVPGIASAAPFGTVNQRQDAIERRIDRGLRSGALDRDAAFRFKAQLRQIVDLHYRYVRSGPGPIVASGPTSSAAMTRSARRWSFRRTIATMAAPATVTGNAGQRNQREGSARRPLFLCRMCGNAAPPSASLGVVT